MTTNQSGAGSLGLPTFSIVMETSNLAGAEIANLWEALASLERQDLSPPAAHEVLLIETGELPVDDLERIRAAYPWVTIHRLKPGTTYAEAKECGASLVTADIVVLCDSDCRYESSWLRNILLPFIERSDVQIVAGETTTIVRGSYGLAMALAHVFPRFSGEQRISPSLWYWANNVAFRRECLARFPLPSELPLYRGQTIVHSVKLRGAGHVIWRQPQARAFHEPPVPSQLIRRFTLAGYDSGTIARLADDRSGKSYLGGMEPPPYGRGRLANFLARVRSVFAEDPQRFLRLPLALPIMLLCSGCYLVGRRQARRAALRVNKLPLAS